MKEKKVYKSAPLPFQGQKRNFVNDFKRVIEEFRTTYQINMVIDLFGGSGLLSHITKRTYPDMRVIYNDYDDYHLRLASVKTTNDLLEKIRGYLSGIPKHQKIEGSIKYLILSTIRDAEKQKQPIDYITLSSSLLFSGKFAKSYQELEKETFYHCIKKSEYNVDGYLEGLEVVKMDYMDLFNAFKWEKGALFIVDPPYLSTDTTTYNSNTYWKLKDYLNVLNVLSTGKYIYFTSNKSSIIELCDWFSSNYHLDNPFTGTKMNTFKATINLTSKYTDMMLYKYQC